MRIPHEAHEPTQTLRLADRRMYAEKGRRIDSAGRQTRNVLMSVLREREPELGDHLQGVAKLAVSSGGGSRSPPRSSTCCRRAAELHDIGKMAIPDEILHKPGPLNEQEWALLRTPHARRRADPRRGAGDGPGRADRALRRTSAGTAAATPTASPATTIPLGARIIFVCDAFDAMTSQRTYKPKIDVEDAIAELRATPAPSSTRWSSSCCAR